jgi:hypothetical protein
MQARLEWDHLVGQVGPPELAAAEAYARGQFIGRMASASADSPHIRAMMLDYLRSLPCQRQCNTS